MKGGAIVPFHHCILFIHVKTFIEDLCIISSKTLYWRDPHQGSKRLYCICNTLSLY